MYGCPSISSNNIAPNSTLPVLSVKVSVRINTMVKIRLSLRTEQNEIRWNWTEQKRDYYLYVIQPKNN